MNIPEKLEREPLPDVDTEAKNRLAQIMSNIESRFDGKKMLWFVMYELQEITSGRTIPDDKVIFNEADLKTLLYSHAIEKKEIRRIIAEIAHRARMALEASEKKAREQKRLKK